MHQFYDNNIHHLGHLAFVKECNLPDSPNNPTGKNAPVWDDAMISVGSIQHGSSVMVLKRPRANVSGEIRMTMFVEVLAPGKGRVWVRACDIETRDDT